MTEYDTYQTKGRPARLSGARTLRYVLALTWYGFRKDLIVFWENIRLMVGSVLLVGGLLSVESGVYCDGNRADHFSCTRPTTYYYFDEVTIGVILLGLILVLLWYMRRIFDYDSA